MAIIGNTIRLKAEFYGVGGEAVSPATAVLRFFDYRKVQMGEDIILTDDHKLDPNVFAYNYTVPDGVGDIFYEFSTVINGYPILSRGKITREWV
jgi:hypothetical protein